MRRTWSVFGVLFALLLAMSPSAVAQSRCASGLCGDSGSGGVQLSSRNERFVQRAATPARNTLHILGGMERPGSLDLGGPAGLSYYEVGAADAGTAVVGAEYGATPELAVGAFVLPLQLFDEFQYNNPRLWATVASSSDIGSAGIRVAIDVPFDGSDFLTSLSVPLMLSFGESGMFDMSPVVRASFGTTVGWLFELPYRITFNLSDEIFFGVHSGISLPEFSGEAASIPLGGFFGYTVSDPSDDPIVDLTFSFRFPTFVTALNDFEEPITDFFVISVGANAFLDLDQG